MSASIDALVNKEYQYGFVTDVDADTIAPGLSEDVVRLISAKKNEPQWLLDWRLKAYRRWLTMTEPHWPNVKYPAIDYQASGGNIGVQLRQHGVMGIRGKTRHFEIGGQPNL